MFSICRDQRRNNLSKIGNTPRILVNAAPMKNLATGIGRYMRELYVAIERLHPDMEIKYFDGLRLCDHMPTSPSASGAWTAAVDAAWRLPPALVCFARTLAHEISARRFYHLSQGFDLYHEAGYFPFKTAGQVKTVFTIHDISLKTMPECHPRDRVLFFRKYFEKSLHRADAIIAPSEFTKSEFQKSYPAVNAKIHPIPLGCDKSLFRTYPQEQIDAFKSRLHLPERYVLFAGTSDPRKNIQAIFKAMAQLPASIKLVCAGWVGWGQGMEKSPQAASLKDRIIFTGYVSDADLALLYAGARVFVYPSFYEGFGLPVLEAMACGCPVVCANTASLPEVAGNASIYCDPHDAACLANAIAEVVASDSLYAKMSRQNLEQAAHFDWSATAEKTLEVFKYAGNHQ